MSDFTFSLNQPVIISRSKTEAKVVARLDNIDCKDRYELRYTDADGNPKEAWFFESELETVSG